MVEYIYLCMYPAIEQRTAERRLVFIPSVTRPSTSVSALELKSNIDNDDGSTSLLVVDEVYEILGTDWLAALLGVVSLGPRA